MPWIDKRTIYVKNMKVIVICFITYYHITQVDFQLQHKIVKFNLLRRESSTLNPHVWIPAFYFKVIERRREHIENKNDSFEQENEFRDHQSRQLI